MTPFRYVMTRRLARGRELLERTRRPANAIAIEVGFKTPSHFAPASVASRRGADRNSQFPDNQVERGGLASRRGTPNLPAHAAGRDNCRRGPPLLDRATSPSAASPPGGARRASAQAAGRGPIIDVQCTPIRRRRLSRCAGQPGHGHGDDAEERRRPPAGLPRRDEAAERREGTSSAAGTAIASRWRRTGTTQESDRFIAAAGIRGSVDTPLPEVAVLRTAFQTGRLRVLGEITCAVRR